MAALRSRRAWAALCHLMALLCAVIALTSGAEASAARSLLGSQRLFAQNPCTPVYASPTASSPLLTQLIGGGDVTALQSITASGANWERVHIWSGLDGYVPASQLGAQPPDSPAEGDCSFPGLPDTPNATIPPDTGPAPFAQRGTVDRPATVFSRPDDQSAPIAAAAVGAPLDTRQWAPDANGVPWYQVSVAGVTGWLRADEVRLSAPDPATRAVNGAPIWAPVAGKGMWFTNYLAHHSDVEALMRAAKLAGVTHLYAEVAITQYGFYGRDSLDRLLPAARQQGVSVIAWVYPTLNDVAADIRMTRQVLQYVGPHGERPDGYATDVEEVDDGASVYAYGQIVRALAGPDALLVAAVFHPFAQAYYPYAAVTASWNVLAPMDYWHSQRDQSYSAQDVRTFTANSLTTIRAAMTALGAPHALPIEELGQTYDMYSPDGVDLGNGPAGAEVTADLQVARDYGCIGASFFEWQTASQDQWAALTQFQW